MKIEDFNYRNYANHLDFLGVDYQTFRKLRTIERKCNRIAMNLANYSDFTIADDWSDKQIEKAVAICPKLAGMKFFINLDPRGYALKIDDAPREMYRDFGGYGIVAPQF